jgi:hypothetical protein
LASSVIWKLPQLVFTVATYFFAGSRRVCGFGSDSSWAGGCGTFWQPASAAVAVPVAFGAGVEAG